MNAHALWILILHLVLTAAPGAAASLLAARRGLRDVPLLLAIGLAGSGITAILAFWAYYADPTVGNGYSFALFCGSSGIAAWCGWALRGSRALLRELAIPVLLWCLGSLFILSFGFLHGGTHDAAVVSVGRFSHVLPTDNSIPLFFSDWFFHHGHQGTPPQFPGHWLSSDRPPLQIGYVLAQRPFAWDAGTLNYQVLGVVLQQLWIVATWALLTAAGLRGRSRGLAIVAMLVSDVGIVHGFFVWPKLLAASFVIAAAVLVIRRGRSTLLRRPATTALFACLLALGLLAHGGSIFALIPLLGLVLVRGVPSWRWIGAGALVAAVLLVPWLAYQRYADPPGNRLTKWQLAGDVRLDQRSTTTAIVDSYRDAGVGGALENKWQNLVTMTGGSRTVTDTADAVGDVFSGNARGAVRTLRVRRFISLVAALGLLIVAPFLMLAARVRHRRPDSDAWGFATVSLWLVLAGCVVWGLMLFGNSASNASIHQGSLALVIFAVCGCVAGLRAIHPRLALWVVGVNALIVLVIYTPALDPLPGTSYSAFAGVLALAALAAFCMLALAGGGATAEASVPARLGQTRSRAPLTQGAPVNEG